MEIAAEDRPDAVQSPSGSNSVAPEELQSEQASPRAAEQATEAAQASHSESAIISSSTDPVREQNDVKFKIQLTPHHSSSAGIAHQEVHSSGWVNGGEMDRG